MKRIALTIIAPAALMLAGCNNQKTVTEAPKTIQQIQTEKGIPVTTAKIGQGVIRRIERSNGTLQGEVEATLANGMGGTVKDIKVSVGDIVNKNDIVAVMEIDGGSPIDVAQSAFEYAQKAYERATKLQAQGAISKEQVDGARVQYENAKRSLGQATVGVNVTAPFTGVVLEIYESEGSKIGEKTRLVKIADISNLEIEMQVNEQSINFYKKGQKSFLLMESDTVWGSIDRIALGANGLAHSFKVTVRFPNQKKQLKPGLFKQVYTIVSEKSNVLYVPIEAVNFTQDNEPYLFSVINGKAVKKVVALGINTGYFYEIIQGCSADDTIIMSGLTMIQDGSHVNVVNK
ncbi:MAG TPA: efflux RND transporter periplasmic adaptor subunit [Chitinispirillaceae bacterium]|nr:efflux RND transporter periplasmic adaptor subunit [Chitinispirillaceae bacterium]